MDFLLGVFAFFAVLGPLVFIHEVGHFVAAKLTGVHIEEFGLGFPPRLVRLWQGVGRLWVAQTGVRDSPRFRLPQAIDEGDRVVALARRAKDDQLELQAIALHDPDQPAPSLAPAGPDEVRLEGTLTRLERGTEYTLNTIPLGGFVRPKAEDDPTVPGGLASASKRVRMFVLSAGAGMNIVAAFLLLTIGFMLGSPQDTPVAVRITEVAQGSPADEAGLQPEDLIFSVNGVEIRELDTLRDQVDAQIADRPGQPLEIIVVRGKEGETGERLTFSLIPRTNPPEGQGKMGVGIRQELDSTLIYYGPLEAAGLGARSVGRVVSFFFEVPALVIQGLVPVEYVRPVSPVGISQLGAGVIRQSQELGQWWPYLQFTAFVSVALAISNLLPLPALDGGRILFVLIEAIRGRRIAPERETAIHFVGMAMLLMLMLVLVVQDFLNPLVGS